jgi:hypothetical protein
LRNRKKTIKYSVRILTFEPPGPLEYDAIRIPEIKIKLKFWIVRLLALRPLLAYCASLG